MNTTTITVRNSLTCLEAVLLCQSTGQTIEALSATGAVSFDWGWTANEVKSRAATR
jgi:hypothetical protein